MKKKILFIILIFLSVTLVIGGLVGMVKTFKSFDEIIVGQKDFQINALLDYEDNNIKHAINSFISESDLIYSEETFKQGEKAWVEYGDIKKIKKVLESSSIRDNSIFVGSIVYKNGEFISKLSDDYRCKFITTPDSSNLRICIDKNKQYFMAYEHRGSNGVRYYQLIGLESLLSDVVSAERSEDDVSFLMYKKGDILVYKKGTLLDVVSIKDNEKIKFKNCLSFIDESNKTGKDITDYIKITNEKNEKNSNRFFVRAAKNTNNEIFTMAKVSNYGEDVELQRNSVWKMFISTSIMLCGIIAIILFLALLNKKTASSLEQMKKEKEVIEDINREMHALAHHQRLEIIGTMTAGIAHDFNNLLTPIMGYSMMTMEMIPEEQKDVQENLIEIYNASLKAKDIVSRLAELARKGNSKAFDSLDLNEIVRNAVKVTLPAKPKEVNIIEKYSCENDVIYGDSTQISQLVMNIVLNAYDAMGEKGILSICTYSENDNVIVEFEDNGPGMSVETIAKAFDPFYTTKASGKGTGLGLAIVAQIAETHNAKVYIESELGKGAKFKVVFKVHHE